MNVRDTGMAMLLAAAVMLLGCQGGASTDRTASGGGNGGAATGRATVEVGGLQALGQVSKVTISVTPAGLSLELTAGSTDGTYAGQLDLPAGSQTVTARAYTGDTLVGQGSATVDVAGGTSLRVVIIVLDLTGPEPQVDHSPVITSLTLPDAVLSVGQASKLTAAAVDIDGDAITFTWSSEPSGCGLFSPESSVGSPAVTTFTAALAGACAVKVEATSHGLTDTRSSSTDHLLAVDVAGVYLPNPLISSMEFLSPAAVAATRSGSDATVRHLWAAGVSVSVRVNWDPTPWLARSTATLVDSCGGEVTSTSTSDAAETFQWTPKAGPVCTLTATVSRQTLVDHFDVAVIAQASPCTGASCIPAGAPAAVAVTLEASSVKVGKTVQAGAEVADAWANVLEAAVTWKSSDTAVATVDATGLVTAVAEGAATITATAGGKTGSASLTIEPAPTCIWTAVRSETLVTLPADAINAGGLAGFRGVTTVGGRTAYGSTSDWAQLAIPAGLGQADRYVSIEVDMYLGDSAYTGYTGVLFLGTHAADPSTPWWLNDYSALHGLWAGLDHSDLSAWKLTWQKGPDLQPRGWGPGSVHTDLDPQAISAPSAGWHHLRISGDLSACAFEASWDAAAVSRFSGACDMAGSNVVLAGNGTFFHAANGFSNLVVSSGSTAACLAAP